MSAWKEIRQQALQRDNRTCQVCGKPNSAQVHHVTPRSKGGKDELSNLITLCGKCHMVISPVPEWLLTKLWKIPPDEISGERERILHRIDELMININMHY